jgi:hypothetical protein
LRKGNNRDATVQVTGDNRAENAQAKGENHGRRRRVRTGRVHPKYRTWDRRAHRLAAYLRSEYMI